MTTREHILSKLAQAKPALSKNYPIRSMALFGSVSRGEDVSDSDVDILVEFSQPAGMQFIHLAYELERILQKKVDLVSKNGIKEAYFKEIQPDLIYV
ncbi:MAG: nucleotidyltransferase family protein [Saprospiraceae bacterium]|nr:nucleotidyltransferase family protein [Saprospiraceae bacterium]